ncbi:hypothetical protein GJ496_004131 [Pomphorhynchus laevis]|nr:hypothetical protein GJ496_004131 [Pomphorhynchus laevis]
MSWKLYALSTILISLTNTQSDFKYGYLKAIQNQSATSPVDVNSFKQISVLFIQKGQRLNLSLTIQNAFETDDIQWTFSPIYYPELGSRNLNEDLSNFEVYSGYDFGLSNQSYSVLRSKRKMFEGNSGLYTCTNTAKSKNSKAEQSVYFLVFFLSKVLRLKHSICYYDSYDSEQPCFQNELGNKLDNHEREISTNQKKISLNCRFKPSTVHVFWILSTLENKTYQLTDYSINYRKDDIVSSIVNVDIPGVYVCLAIDIANIKQPVGTYYIVNNISDILKKPPDTIRKKSILNWTFNNVLSEMFFFYLPLVLVAVFCGCHCMYIIGNFLYCKIKAVYKRRNANDPWVDYKSETDETQCKSMEIPEE